MLNAWADDRAAACWQEEGWTWREPRAGALASCSQKHGRQTGRRAEDEGRGKSFVFCRFGDVALIRGRQQHEDQDFAPEAAGRARWVGGKQKAGEEAGEQLAAGREATLRER